jgi:Flp pilus assembly protein TadD
MVPAVCGSLLLAVVLVFGQTAQHGFVNYDDDAYVYNNPHVKVGLTAQGIAWAFTSNYYHNWHPLTSLSHIVDYQLYGLRPCGHHLGNVLLHAATAILLFLVLRRMTGRLWPSAFAAAVWAVHPLRVESVAWVSERKDVLSGLFFVLTLWAYASYVERPASWGRYIRVVVFFALGLMTKPMLVTVPFVLLLLDYWPLGRMESSPTNNLGGKRLEVRRSPLSEKNVPPSFVQRVRRLVIEKIPLLLLAVASCVVTFVAQGGAVRPLELVPLPWRIANALVSYAAYLWQFVCPVGLAVIYPHPGDNLPAWHVAVALLVLVGISLAVLAARRKHPYLLVGWLWYVGMLVPVIGLVQVGGQAMADRYTYLTQIGLCVALAWGVANVAGSWPYHRWLLPVSSSLVVVILMGCAWRQTGYWRDSESLWTHTLACTSNNAVAHNNLGIVLGMGGLIEEAIPHFQEALKIRPDYPNARRNLALARSVQEERLLKALAERRELLNSRPDDVALLNETAWLLATNPSASIRNGTEAVKFAQQAVGVSGARQPAILGTLAAAYAETGEFTDAVQIAQQALALASAEKKVALADALRVQIELYRAGSPYRDIQQPPQGDFPRDTAVPSTRTNGTEDAKGSERDR